MTFDYCVYTYSYLLIYLLSYLLITDQFFFVDNHLRQLCEITLEGLECYKYTLKI